MTEHRYGSLYYVLMEMKFLCWILFPCQLGSKMIYCNEEEVVRVMGRVQLKKSRENTRTSLVAQMVKHLSKMREIRVRSLGREDTLEKEMATHSSTLAWKTPWKQPTGSQGVGED